MSYPPNRRCSSCGTRYWAEDDRPCPECIRVGDVVRTQGGYVARVVHIATNPEYKFNVLLEVEGRRGHEVLSTLTLVRRGDGGGA